MRVLGVNNAKAEAQWQELPSPKVEKGQIRIQVEAAGLNRADLLQIKGLYPGKIENPILGLECSGVIDKVGEGIDEAWLGRKVCALLRGGGISEYVVCSPSVIVSAPSGIELSLAGGLCETWCTVLFNLWDQARLLPKEKLLIHAGASGVGIAAIQLARLLGAIPYITCGNEEKLRYCLDRGAEGGALRTGNWADHFHELQLKFDVILDPVGAGYLNKDLSLSANSARIAVIGLLGGIETECNLLEFLSRNVTLFGRTLRTQSNPVKRRLLAELETIVWPAVARGKVHHGVEQIVMPDEIVDAYQSMQHGEQIGKTIVLMK